MLPMWYMAQDRTAYWNKFSFPQTRPTYSSGFDGWWYDVNKAAASRGPTLRIKDGRLPAPPTITGDPDALGHHHHQFLSCRLRRGPVDQAIAAVEFGDRGALPGAGDSGMGASHARTGVGNISEGHYRGGRGLDPEVIAEITHRYGFDKPIHERYFKMLGDYLRFDFGDSLFRSASVLQLIKDSLPVSITLGLWSTLIIYGVDTAGDP